MRSLDDEMTAREVEEVNAAAEIPSAQEPDPYERALLEDGQPPASEPSAPSVAPTSPAVESAAGAWPESLLHPHGLVGDVAQYILDRSGIPQPKFSLAAALVVCGTLVGRAVRDYSGQMTNIYALAVIPSSGGKNDPMNIGMKIIQALGMGGRCAARVTSDSAIEAMLENGPTRCLFIDEVGDYLGSVKAAGKNNSHLMSVIPCLKEMWSRGDGVYIGKTRARPSGGGDWRPPVLIDRPHLSVYGTGAPDRLFASLSDRDFEDGSIPRFDVYLETRIPRRRDVPSYDVEERLLERLRAQLQRLGVKIPAPAGLAASVPGSLDERPLTVHYTQEAASLMEEFEDFKYAKICEAEDDRALYLWGKTVEKAHRIALTVAVFRETGNVRVEKEDAEFAIALEKRLTNDMVGACRDKVLASRIERDMSTVLRHVERAGRAGIPLSDLTRATRSMSPNRRHEVLDNLLEEGRIEELERQGTGLKPVHWYVATGK